MGKKKVDERQRKKHWDVENAGGEVLYFKLLKLRFLILLKAFLVSCCWMVSWKGVFVLDAAPISWIVQANTYKVIGKVVAAELSWKGNGAKKLWESEGQKERDVFFKKKREERWKKVLYCDRKRKPFNLETRRFCFLPPSSASSSFFLSFFRSFFLSSFLSFKFSLRLIYNEVLKRETRWKKGI